MDDGLEVRILIDTRFSGLTNVFIENKSGYLFFTLNIEIPLSR